jgi:hypothetical protein
MPSKSSNYSFQALARAKKAAGKFSDKLRAPIVIAKVSPGLLGPMLQQREIAERRLAKLPDLLVHYNIHANDDDRWVKLFLLLATNFVPGMIAVEERPTNRRGRKIQRWTFEQYSELVRDVDAVRAAIGTRKKIYIATAQLREQSEKWGRYSAFSLVTRYHEGKAKIREREKLLELASRPLWAGLQNMTGGNEGR